MQFCVYLELLPLLVASLHHEVAGLEVPVDQVVGVEVLVILAKRVDQHLGHVQPAEVEHELEEGEYRKRSVNIVVVISDQVHRIGRSKGHLSCNCRQCLSQKH